MLRFIVAPVICLFVVSATWADNWGHWRGPTGNSVSTTATPPIQWSATKNVKWKVAIPGRGSGSPIVWDDRVFVVTAVPAAGRGAAVPRGNSPTFALQKPSTLTLQRRRAGGRGGPLPTLEFTVLCFGRNDGKLLWKRVATVATPHQGTHSTNGFASASPCTDGERVFAHFGSRGLYCYSMDGELLWKRTDFEPMNTRAGFGEGSSPTIAGDKILVPYDHEGQSYLYAINKLTGETIWQTPRDEPSCWATPLVVQVGGAAQVVMNGQTAARGYDLESGQELWRCGGQAQRPVASAVAANGLAFIGSGYQGSFLGAFRLDGRGDIEGTEKVAWTIGRDTPDIASPLLSSGRLYFHKGKSGQLSCLDASSGRAHYVAKRIPGVDRTYASPIAAGGHIYLTGRSGTTTVINDSDQLQIVATNSVDETVDATPAPVDDELFIRGERHLFCISG